MLSKSVDEKEKLRHFFQRDVGRVRKTLDFLKYHRSYLYDLDRRYSMNIIDTPNSRKFLIDSIQNRGDNVIKGIIKTITSLKGIELYAYQLDFVKVIIPTLFKYIYKGEWKHKREEILKRHGMDDVYDEVFFTSPRRMGKTITLAYSCLSIISNFLKDPNRPLRIAVFATGMDASKRFIDECELGWRNINVKNEFYYERTANEIKITKKSDPSDIRFITAFCGSGPVSFFLNIHVCVHTLRRKKGGGGR